jgi:hypothetical protein
MSGCQVPRSQDSGGILGSWNLAPPGSQRLGGRGKLIAESSLERIQPLQHLADVVEVLAGLLDLGQQVEAALAQGVVVLGPDQLQQPLQCHPARIAQRGPAELALEQHPDQGEQFLLLLTLAQPGLVLAVGRDKGIFLSGRHGQNLPDADLGLVHGLGRDALWKLPQLSAELIVPN